MAAALIPFPAGQPGERGDRPEHRMLVEPVYAVLAGYPNQGRFRRLNASTRNCTLPASPSNPTLVSLTNEKSKPAKPSVRKILRPEVPICPSGPRPNMSGLNQLFGLCRMTVLGSNGTK